MRNRSIEGTPKLSDKLSSDGDSIFTRSIHNATSNAFGYGLLRAYLFMLEQGEEECPQEQRGRRCLAAPPDFAGFAGRGRFAP